MIKRFATTALLISVGACAPVSKVDGHPIAFVLALIFVAFTLWFLGDDEGDPI